MINPPTFVEQLMIESVPASITGNALNLTFALQEVCDPMFPIVLPSVTLTVYTPSSVASKF